MAKPIVFAPQAREEVNTAARQYGEERPELRVEFHAAVKEALGRMVRLSRHLGTPPLVDLDSVSSACSSSASHSPCTSSSYRPDSAVAHGRRMPFYWRERL